MTLSTSAIVQCDKCPRTIHGKGWMETLMKAADAGWKTTKRGQHFCLTCVDTIKRAGGEDAKKLLKEIDHG